MSFALTTEQVLNRTKTVTRRRGTWWATVLRPGSLLCAVEKSQGIARGTLRRLCVIRVTDVSVERLDAMLDPMYGDAEAISEGFPCIRGSGFVDMFAKAMRVDPSDEITRIEFAYTELPLSGESK